MKSTLNAAYGVTLRRGASLLCLCMALSACDMFTSADKLKSDATAALTARNYSSAAQIAQKWTEKSPEHYEAFFMLAQAQAQAGDKNAALMALEQAIKKGLKDDAQVDGNANLEPIKDMSAYQTLMKTSFPDRKPKQGEAQKAEGQNDGEVSITEKDGQQVLRAGDVVIQMPVSK